MYIELQIHLMLNLIILSLDYSIYHLNKPYIALCYHYAIISYLLHMLFEAFPPNPWALD